MYGSAAPKNCPDYGGKEGGGYKGRQHEPKCETRCEVRPNAGPVAMKERIEHVSLESRYAVEHALDPTEGILAKRKMVILTHFKPHLSQNSPQGMQRKVEKVARKVKMKPCRSC